MRREPARSGAGYDFTLGHGAREVRQYRDAEGLHVIVDARCEECGEDATASLYLRDAPSQPGLARVGHVLRVALRARCRPTCPECHGGT